MKRVTLISLLFLVKIIDSQTSFPLVIGRTGNACENDISVRNVKDNMESCDYPEGVVLYPVYIEEFDYKSELPNNWDFSGQDDDAKGEGRGLCWIGDGQDGYESYNRDLVVAGGTAFLKVNQANPPAYKSACGTCPSKNYDFTTTQLKSWFRVREGITRADIRIPNNWYMWPAYWLFGSASDNQEIDIFEFTENNHPNYLNNCDYYSDMKMTIHGKNNGHECQRGRKFPTGDFSSTFMSDYHLYESVYTDYKVEINVDGSAVARATKYYEGSYTPSGVCHKHGDDNHNGLILPHSNYVCTDISDLDDCNVYWPFTHNCANENEIQVDNSFPRPSIQPSQVIINNSINLYGNMKDNGGYDGHNYSDLFLQDWDNFDQADREMAIRRFEMWQPINCNAVHIISTEGDFYANSSNTSFLGGNQIIVGGGAGFKPRSNQWGSPDDHRKNFQFLAVDYIEFNGEVEINSGGTYPPGGDDITYLRAEIIDDCSTYLSFSQKSANSGLSGNSNSNTDLSAQRSSKSGISEMDNGAVSIFPNPTTNFIYLQMMEEDYNDIKQMEIIDNLGRKFTINKNHKIDVSDLPNGFYQLRIIFTHGYILIKAFVKQ